MTFFNNNQRGITPIATLVDGISESVICNMTRLANQLGAVNLAEGLPDFAPALLVADAALTALQGDGTRHQAENTWGYAPLREAIAAYNQERYGIAYHPETEITVTTGATEGIYAGLAAVINPGDEVILLEPFYESYLPVIKLLGAVPVFVPLQPPVFALDVEAVIANITPKTKAIIVNSPCNPTGTIFSPQALRQLGLYCATHGIYILSDEVYENLLYDNDVHTPMATLDEAIRPWVMTLQTVSKTFSATGWRVGWVLANPTVTEAIRKIHDVLSAGTVSHWQVAASQLLVSPQLPQYLTQLSTEFHQRRAVMKQLLQKIGFPVETIMMPQGAYYFWLPVTALGFETDLIAVDTWIRQRGFSVVPGRCFYRTSPQENSVQTQYVRVCFAKKISTLTTVLAQLDT
jgi:aspartate/methionine/tyrosine aminotransferase